jgi:hypothetical protein
LGGDAKNEALCAKNTEENNMKVIMMNGGLGNQLFQYIFFRFVEINSGEDCCIDDRFFSAVQQHNGYELERIFGLKPKLLRDRFKAKAWREIVAETVSRVNIIDSLAARGVQLIPFSEGSSFADHHNTFETKFDGSIYSMPMNQYIKDAATVEGDLYYFGYWINMHWFQNVRDEIVSELTFPPFAPDDDYNARMLDRIDDTHSVSVHVRRGDFLSLNWAMNPAWYVPHIESIRQYVRNPVFFIFSDDIPWCQKNMLALGLTPGDQIVWMDGNTGRNNFRDMQLMSHCKNMLLANSSFSYLAALLNQTPNKYVINPVETRQIL